MWFYQHTASSNKPLQSDRVELKFDYGEQAGANARQLQSDRVELKFHQPRGDVRDRKQLQSDRVELKCNQGVTVRNAFTSFNRTVWN